MNINDRIKGAITASGKTQADVAKELGISQSALSQRLSAKNIAVTTVMDIARVIGVSVGDLLEPDQDFVQAEEAVEAEQLAKEYDQLLDELDEWDAYTPKTREHLKRIFRNTRDDLRGGSE